MAVRLYPIVTRYAWPSELDLMARIAGLRLKPMFSPNASSCDRDRPVCYSMTPICGNYG